MVVEEFLSYPGWLGPALLWFFVILCVCVVLGTLYGFMVSAVRNGPGEAFFAVATVIAQSVPDLFHTSPRRVSALAKLAIQEAFRRRIILVTFSIFAIALLFGGWFLDVRSDKPHEIYMSFVLNGTQLLVLLVAIMISCFSLPQDIRNRTIYTVVTKPVRPLEIVLGRIFGFGLMGTTLLLAMGILSYFFVVNGLRHNHDVLLDSFEEVDQSTGLTVSGRRASVNAVLDGETTFDHQHRHRIELVELAGNEGEDGPYQFALQVMPTAGHGHPQVIVEGDRPDYLTRDGVFTFENREDYRQALDLFNESSTDSRMRIRVGNAQGYLQARVPMYAKTLRFLDRAGNPTTEGVSVGDEWEYRSYIDGGLSQSRAIFEFEGFRESRFGGRDTIPLEMTLGVYRTHKGDIEQRVTGTITLKNEIDGVLYESDPIIFESQEFQVQELQIPRTVRARWNDDNGTPQSADMDLFKEFAPEGKMELWLQCNDAGQFFGVARADVYFRQQENSFYSNFIKGYLGIWMQMMIVISMGVMFSTFVSGPVAMMGCISMLVVMSNTQFISDLATHELAGGGPIEATWRIVTQNNVTSELEGGTTLTIVQSVDWVLTQIMNIVATSVPDLSRINTMEELTRGYNISVHSIAAHFTMALGFCIVVALVGYFRMKTREIAA